MSSSYLELVPVCFVDRAAVPRLACYPYWMRKRRRQILVGLRGPADDHERLEVAIEEVYGLRVLLKLLPEGPEREALRGRYRAAVVARQALRAKLGTRG
jgi:hypothetical protein